MPKYDLTKMSEEELYTTLAKLESKKKLLAEDALLTRRVRCKVTDLLSILSSNYLKDPYIRAQIDRLQYDNIDKEIEEAHIIKRLVK